MAKQRDLKRQEQRKKQQEIKKQQEKILREYFEERRRPWFKRIIYVILITIVLHTVLYLWWSTYAEYYAQVLHATMEQPFLRPLQTYIASVLNNLQPSWISFIATVERLPVFTSVYQFFNIYEPDRTSFLLGIVLPTGIIVLLLFIQILSGIFKRIFHFFTWRSTSIDDQNTDNILWEDILADQIVSDEEVDEILHARVENLVKESIGRLAIDEDECRMKLVVRAPIMWQSIVTPIVSGNDLQWRRGQDGTVRFGVYRVLVIHLTDSFMGVFSCYYNFIRNHAMNTSVKQHQYADIASVSLSEFDDDVALTLPSGRELLFRRQFRIVFKNGEKLTVTTNATKLSQEVGVSHKLDETSAEAALQFINKFLRERDALK